VDRAESPIHERRAEDNRGLPIMSRWKAAAIHLGLSAAVATTIIVTMLSLWYPPPYFLLMGGTMLVVLIVGCDVVLGPLITAIIFKSGKKGLIFDLAVIAFLQSIALTYGLYTMFEARPVYTVFAVDRFEVTAANEISSSELERASPEYASLPLTGPRVVAAILPADPQERLGIAMRAMGGGTDIKALPRLYAPYKSIATTAAEKARPLAQLEKKNPLVSARVIAELRNDPSAPHASGYLPIVGRFRSMTAIVNKRSGEIETIVNVNPW
jgi:hypothetical protein